jgi:hypothetical protein
MAKKVLRDAAGFSATSGNHHGVRKAAAVVPITTLLALGGFGVLAGSAAAASCAAITVAGAPVGKALVVTPGAVKVPVKGCVSITNAAVATLNITVKGAGASPTSASASVGHAASFSFGSTGTATISVKGTLLILSSTGTATVTVTPPAAATTVKPTHKPSPTPSRTASSEPATHPTHPTVASAPKGSHSKQAAQPLPTGITLPPLPPLPGSGLTATRSLGTTPLVAGLPLAANSPAAGAAKSSRPRTVALAGSIEPLNKDNRGLPVAIAILVLLGLSTGFGRAVLGVPAAVDNGAGGPRRP